MREVEAEEAQLREEVLLFQKELDRVREANVSENVLLEYETNKNWINFREKKKQLELKHKEILLKLRQSEELHKKVTQVFEEKSNQSYNYFEQKHVALADKKELVS